jgi:hypothetical protein
MVFIDTEKKTIRRWFFPSNEGRCFRVSYTEVSFTVWLALVCVVRSSWCLLFWPMISALECPLWQTCRNMSPRPSFHLRDSCSHFLCNVTSVKSVYISSGNIRNQPTNSSEMDKHHTKVGHQRMNQDNLKKVTRLFCSRMPR